MRFATFIVFSLLCLCVYAYLVKYFTPMMTEVIAVTDPYLHDFHAALGVAPHVTNVSSQSPQPQSLPTPAPTQTPTPQQAQQQPQQQQQLPMPAPQPAKAEEDMPTSIVAISNPSGAEIFINDKTTGSFTPGRVEIPSGKFTISIRKHGYRDYVMTDASKSRIGHRLVANLEKSNVAYIDIDVFPPQDALIYINGKLLPRHHGPIRELPVAANTPLRVRAETRNLTSYDEVVVNVPVEKRQSVQLHPHKPLRLPSNLPNQ